jgi:pimeloyl-ACP methyl ester carboxylesterase
MRDGKPNPVMSFVAKVGLFGFWAPRFWLSYWSGLFPVKKPADFDAYRSALLANLREPGRIAALRNLAFAGNASIEAALGKASAPVLLVMGTKDKDFQDATSEARGLGEIVHGKVELINTGHYPHVEEPDQTAALVIRFLGSR